VQTYFKVFFVIAALVAAFLLGRNFGFETKTEELTLNKQQQAKEVQNKEVVEKAKQFDIVKRRLQDIVDSVGTQNKDELLSQIFNVLFVDMGLSIKSETPKVAAAVSTETTNAAVISSDATPASLAKANTTDSTDKKTQNEKLNVENPQENVETLAKTREQKKILAEIQNQNLNSEKISADKTKLVKNTKPEAKKATVLKPETNCSGLIGMYKGSIKDIKNKYFGSLTVYFKQDANKKIKGAVTLLSDQNKIALSKSFSEQCGAVTPNGLFRVINLSPTRYLQIEKANKSKNVVGTFYEILPKGTEKEVGSFVLNRIDRF
jgi:hypothetical protein